MESEIIEVEIDIFEFVERGEEVPHAKSYRVRIDGESVKVDTPTPTGEMLLGKVDKRPCAHELIEERQHHENLVIEPNETVNLRKPGLRGFITAHKEIVTIFINGDPYSIERGNRTVAKILSEVGQTPEGYDLLEEKHGPPVPLAGHSCENSWLRDFPFSGQIRRLFVGARIMTYTQAQTDQLKPYCSKLSSLVEAGLTYFLLPDLKTSAWVHP